MSPQPDPEIVLYDLACTKNVCFSPVVWRIRLLLNYKQIPYRTVFLEFPDIVSTLQGLGIPPHQDQKHKYTVPAIHHIPSNTHIMDSLPIAQFIESTYPAPPVSIATPETDELERRVRAIAGPVLYRSILPREIRILTTRAQAYFRRTREAGLGGAKLEDMLEGEEMRWEDAREGRRGLDELLGTAMGEGQFLGGETPNYTDLFIAGSLQSASTVDEGVFERAADIKTFKTIYEACLPWMEKKD